MKRVPTTVTIASPPLDVQTEDGGSYDPFASGAAVTIFGQGVRNAYDLVWHSNGFLYVPTNGSAPGNTPASDPADSSGGEREPWVTADVAAVVSYCAQRSIPVLPRGGGTSLAGQSVNEAVVLDFTAEMGSLLEVDPEGRTATAQAGAILGDINAALAPHDLKFAPDPAWGDKSALGGAIGNNSTGAHSLKYGKTDAYIESCEVVLADGTVTEFGEVTIGEDRHPVFTLTSLSDPYTDLHLAPDQGVFVDFGRTESIVTCERRGYTCLQWPFVFSFPDEGEPPAAGWSAAGYDFRLVAKAERNFCGRSREAYLIEGQNEVGWATRVWYHPSFGVYAVMSGQAREGELVSVERAFTTCERGLFKRGWARAEHSSD